MLCKYKMMYKGNKYQTTSKVAGSPICRFYCDFQSPRNGPGINNTNQELLQFSRVLGWFFCLSCHWQIFNYLFDEQGTSFLITEFIGVEAEMNSCMQRVQNSF